MASAVADAGAVSKGADMAEGAAKSVAKGGFWICKKSYQCITSCLGAFGAQVNIFLKENDKFYRKS